MSKRTEIWAAVERVFQARTSAAVLNTGLVAVLVAISAEFVRSVVAGETNRYPVLVSLATVLALAVVLVQQSTLRSAMEKLDKRAGLSIKYYKANTREEIAELHREAGRVIRNAPERGRIRAVNSYVEVFKAANDPGDTEAQRTYLKAFEDKFGQLRSYHRIIQLKTGGIERGYEVELASLLCPAYLEHYKEIVAHKESNPDSAIVLDEATASIPISFVIVQPENGSGGEIIWQMHKHAPRNEDPSAVQVLGIFIIKDPDGLVIRHFEDWFSLVDRGRSAAVTRALLTPSLPGDSAVGPSFNEVGGQ